MASELLEKKVATPLKPTNFSSNLEVSEALEQIVTEKSEDTQFSILLNDGSLVVCLPYREEAAISERIPSLQKTVSYTQKTRSLYKKPLPRFLYNTNSSEITIFMDPLATN
jgi:hypothetical protein